MQLIECPVSFSGKNSSDNYSKTQPETYSSDNFNIQLYSNPTTAEFQLSVNNLNKEFMEVKIMDATGKSIKLLKMQTNETIKLGSALPSGIYFVKILLNNKRKLRRLIKY
ncbi:MAG: T9SS type A sorting domain-containing protein [Ferruginibacter sp.]